MSRSREPWVIVDVINSKGEYEKKLLVDLIVFSRTKADTIFQILLPGSIAIIGLMGFLYVHQVFYLVIFALGSFYLYKSIFSWQKIEIHNEQIIARPLVGKQHFFFATNISNIYLHSAKKGRRLIHGTSIEFNNDTMLVIPSSFQGKSMHEIILNWSKVYKIS